VGKGTHLYWGKGKYQTFKGDRYYVTEDMYLDHCQSRVKNEKLIDKANVDLFN